MLPSKALLSFILIGFTTVDANPLGRDAGKAVLPLTRKINRSAMPGLVEHDRARARFLQNPNEKRKRSLISKTPPLTYTTLVGIGNPPSNYLLTVDTSSGNTWVGSNVYTQTTTSDDTGNSVAVVYFSGDFTGEEWEDTVTISGLTINAQSIGVATVSDGFSGVDGVLGLGPAGLTSDTVTGKGIVPTVMDNLFSQGAIAYEMLSLYFTPFNIQDDQMFTFGELDESVIAGLFYYTPVTTTWPASAYWGFDQSIHYGNTTILSTTAGIVDSGTSLVFIASDAFEKYQSATGGVVDAATGLLTVSQAQFDALKPLSFRTGDGAFALSPNAQIWPRALNTLIGGRSDAIYLVVADLGTPSGSGLDFVSGSTFLQRFYSIYDTASARVGFSATAYTDSKSN